MLLFLRLFLLWLLLKIIVLPMITTTMAEPKPSLLVYALRLRSSKGPHLGRAQLRNNSDNNDNTSNNNSNNKKNSSNDKENSSGKKI